jgi:hypothetical protein
MKWYDEIVKQSLVTQNPPEPELVKKLASIGIGPGKTPSGEANDTIKQVLQTGIQEGEKMISSQLASVREVINGWGVIST